MEPLRYPIKPLSSEEDSSDNVSEVPSNDTDADVGEEASATSAQYDATNRPSMDEIVDVEDDTTTLPEIEVAGCFSNDSSPEVGT